ncbi:hypothetical protein ACFQYP_00590 [Nonomuraea antimicrobica]
MSTQEIILAISGGLLVNEFCDISPWAAQRIVAWSARLRYGRSARATIRAEELGAVIDSRPGKLFKLFTALAFVPGATRAYLSREILLALLYVMIVFSRPGLASEVFIGGHARRSASGKRVFIRAYRRRRGSSVLERRFLELVEEARQRGSLSD